LIIDYWLLIIWLRLPRSLQAWQYSPFDYAALRSGQVGNVL